MKAVVKKLSGRGACSSLAAAALSTAVLVACGASFDTVGQLDGVRVLGVKKSSPYPRPGEEVQLDMLVHDTGPAKGEPQTRAPLQTMWLAGCYNPAADLYQGCFAQFGALLGAFGLSPDEPIDPSMSDELLAELAKGGIQLGFGPQFRFTVPKDLVTRRGETSPGVEPYGLSYVFFAACAGTLRPNLEPGGFPIQCVDAKGELLPQRDFVAGYTALYSYEERVNRNPVLSGFSVNGKKLKSADVCLDQECSLLPWDGSRKCTGDEPVVSPCADEDNPLDCPKLEFKPLVDEASVEADPVATRDLGQAAEEQMWVNYHSDRGRFSSDLSLVNDATAGFNQKLKGEFRAPEAKGKAHVWTVVRDNRGGSAWGRFDVCVK